MNTRAMRKTVSLLIPKYRLKIDCRRIFEIKKICIVKIIRRIGQKLIQLRPNSQLLFSKFNCFSSGKPARNDLEEDGFYFFPNTEYIGHSLSQRFMTLKLSSFMELAD